MNDSGMVIVGAGEAGARAALALREHGWGGIFLYRAGAALALERPPLSKDVLVGEADVLAPPVILAPNRKRNFASPLCPAAGWRRSIAPPTRSPWRAAEGSAMNGCCWRPAPGCGDWLSKGPMRPTCFICRSAGRCHRLRSRLRNGTRLAIIGGGFIGLEVAASAVARGCVVTLIESGPGILRRGVPEPLSAVIADRHRAAGVNLRLGCGIQRIGVAGNGRYVVLADGSRIDADVIVAGIGEVPETELAQLGGLAIDNGVKVDATLATSDKDVFAAGDCCSFPHGLYGNRRIRLEAWRNAVDQADVAARNMLGGQVAYEAVPWFWSDQYDLTLQIAGLPDEGTATVHRDTGAGCAVNFYLAPDGRLVAAGGVGPISGMSKDIRLAEMLIARRAKPDAEALASPKVRLKSLLGSA